MAEEDEAEDHQANIKNGDDQDNISSKPAKEAEELVDLKDEWMCATLGSII